MLELRCFLRGLKFGGLKTVIRENDSSCGVDPRPPSAEHTLSPLLRLSTKLKTSQRL